jgi:hypothetical protein
LSLQPSSQQQQLLAMHCDVVAVALGVRSSLPSYAFLVTLQVEINCSRPLLDPCPIFLLFGHFPKMDQCSKHTHTLLRSAHTISLSLYIYILVTTQLLDDDTLVYYQPIRLYD